MPLIRAASLLVLLMGSASAARVRTSLQPSGCKNVLKNNYCPVQITDHLLELIGGKPPAELACIGEFCAKELAAGGTLEDGQCCKIQEAIKLQLQGRLAAGLKADVLENLRNAVGVTAEVKAPVEPKAKPIWEIEAEKRRAEEREAEAAHHSQDDAADSASDEMCLCPMAGRGVNLAGAAEYKKSQLFTQEGACTSTHACNRCYHAPTSGVFGCCLKNANGAPVDCAPELQKPTFNGEYCLCEGTMGRTLKSTLYEQGAKHCHPQTPCSVCKARCSNR